MSDTQKQILVFDLPVRVLHWVFAIGFVGAFLISKIFDHNIGLFPFHAIFGIMMVTSLILRIFWGVFGPKYSRFSSFNLNPADLIKYLTSTFDGTKKPIIGRNPASSYAAILMFLCAGGIGISGYLMATHQGNHGTKEWHELFANIFLLVVIAHIAGIFLHTATLKDPIGHSMVHGKKSSENEGVGIAKPLTFTGILMAILLGGTGIALANSYNPQNQSLNIFGKELIIKGHHGHGKHGKRDEHRGHEGGERGHNERGHGEYERGQRNENYERNQNDYDNNRRPNEAYEGGYENDIFSPYYGEGTKDHEAYERNENHGNKRR